MTAVPVAATRDDRSDAARAGAASWLVLPLGLAAAQALVMDKVLHEEVAYAGLVVALAVLVVARRSAPGRLLAGVVLAAWVFADLAHPVGWQFEVVVTTSALLWAVAFAGTGFDLAAAPLVWRRSVHGAAAAMAAAGLVLALAGHLINAIVAGGFGLGLVVVALAMPSARKLVADNAGSLVFVGVLGVASSGFFASALSGPRAWTFGVISAGLVVVLIDGRLVAQVPAAVMWLAIGIPFMRLSGGVAGVAMGTLCLVGLGSVPQPRRWRWARGAALVPWLVILAVAALAFSRARPAHVLAGLLLASAVATLVPWPDRVIALGTAAPIRARIGRLVDHAHRGAMGAADALQRGIDRVGRALGRPIAWILAPTWPAPDGAPEPGRSVLRRYAVPLGAWTVGVTLVPLLARIMAAVDHDLPVPWRTLALAPWSTDITGRIGWGTGDYYEIATHGYHFGDAREAAFPLVALAARWLHQAVGIGIPEAQVVVALVSGLAATLLFWAFLAQVGVLGRARVLALVLFLAYPYSFVFYGYGYADVTLVALVLGAFVLLEADRPVLAGIVAGFATATRPNAMPLIPAMLIFELLRSGAVQVHRPAPGGLRAWRTWRPGRLATVELGRMGVARWGVLLSLWGVVAYSTWLIGHAGSPLYWLTAQGHYGHGSILSPRTWLKVDFFAAPNRIVTNLPWAANEVVAACLILGAIALIVPVLHRLGGAYAAFVAGVVIIAWEGPRGFAPAGRYLLPALPMLLVVVAEWAEERARLQVAVLLVCVAGTAALVALFPLGGDLWLEW